MHALTFYVSIRCSCMDTLLMEPCDCVRLFSWYINLQHCVIHAMPLGINVLTLYSLAAPLPLVQSGRLTHWWGVWFIIMLSHHLVFIGLTCIDIRNQKPLDSCKISRR